MSWLRRRRVRRLCAVIAGASVCLAGGVALVPQSASLAAGRSSCHQRAHHHCDHHGSSTSSRATSTTGASSTTPVVIVTDDDLDPVLQHIVGEKFHYVGHRNLAVLEGWLASRKQAT